MDLVDLVVDCSAPSSCGVLIDVGCGKGEFAAEVAAQLRPRLCVGVDVERPGASTAMQGVRADAVSLPFRGQVADVVTARALLHHVNDVEGVLSELARAVAPGGWLFVSDATPLEDRTFVEMNRELEAAGLPPERHPGFEPDYVAGRISAGGLSVIHKITDGNAVFATPPFVSRIYGATRLLVAARRTP